MYKLSLAILLGLLVVVCLSQDDAAPAEGAPDAAVEGGEAAGNGTDTDANDSHSHEAGGSDSKSNVSYYLFGRFRKDGTILGSAENGGRDTAVGTRPRKRAALGEG